MTTPIKAQRGNQLRCRGWRQEALLRLLENVLENAENQSQLIVYAALARAARTWEAYHQIVAALKRMDVDETLVIQSGKPIGLMKTHAQAPLVLMATCNLVGRWATSENFYDLQEKGLIIWGGLTAAAWQYIGSQGVIQGTYEIFCAIADQSFGGDLRNRLILTAGLGGMGGAQPLAATMAQAKCLVVEIDESRVDKRLERGYLQHKTSHLDEALKLLEQDGPLSVGLIGHAADIYPEILRRGIVPDIVTDQTAAHDLRYGYVPSGYSLSQWKSAEKDQVEKDAGASIAREVEAMLAFKAAGSVVFDNGNNIRTQAKIFGVANAFDIDIFTEAYLRPLFCRGIGPFRWIALSGEVSDIARIDQLLLDEFGDIPQVKRWIPLARNIPVEGLPARIAWLGHHQRTRLALRVNELVQSHELSAPIAFTRDHLDAAAMAHPNIMTEKMLDGSDAIADWPLLNAMLNCSSQADLVAIHSGGGGYAGYMTSAGVTLVADGSPEAARRLELTLDNDTGLGVLRYADAGYDLAIEAAKAEGLGKIHYGEKP
jgi:urocanate hydratase